MKFVSSFSIIALALCLAPATVSGDITENFTYPVQFDSTGFNDGGTQVYRITETGAYGGVNDRVVGSFSEGFANGAGIAAGPSNFFAIATTFADSGFNSGEVLFAGIVDVPGIADTSTGGVFGNFFSVPRDFSDVRGSVDLGQLSGIGTTSFRLLGQDVNGNEATTNTTILSTSFTRYNFRASDFVNIDQGFDPTQVIAVGVEFFATADAQGNIDAFQFGIDTFRVANIPEPGYGVAILVVSAILVSRRRR